MLPEISRRCLACGASVRRGARFCHQCGADTENPAAVAERGAQERTDEAESATTLVDDAPLELPEPPDTGALVQTWEQWDESMHAREEDGRGAVAASSTVEPHAAVEPSSQVEAPSAVEPSSTVEPSRVVSTATVEEGEVGVEPEADERAGSGGRRRPSAIVRENLRPRMEKMREASIVVMEEASEDTGLRFILIAVALFVLFLLFLFVSSFLR